MTDTGADRSLSGMSGEASERFAGWDGRDVGPLEELFASQAARPRFVEQLLEGLEGEREAQLGCSWLLKRWLDDGGEPTRAQAGQFCRALAGLGPWEARLHALQCLGRVPIPARSRRAVERFVRAALEDEVKFVRAWAYTGLDALARAFDELRPEVERLMRRGLREGPASVRARIRRLGYGRA